MFRTDKGIVVAILILGLLGIMLLGVGFTGKVVFNGDTQGDVCSQNSECSTGKVCCLFYGQEAGVCNSPDICDTVTTITKEEGNKLEAWNVFQTESPKNDNTYSLEITFGILILIIVGISIYIVYRDKKKKAGKKSVKKTKKNKKRKK